MFYTLTTTQGFSTLTIFKNDGNWEPYVVDSTHPNWDTIVDLVRDGYEEVFDVIDSSKKVSKVFSPINPNISVRGNNVYFKFEPITGPYEDLLIEAVNNGEQDTIESIANFLDLVYSSTSANVRENLGRWMHAQKTITCLPNGHILGFKSVKDNRESWHRGPAIIDGQPSPITISNDGSVVSMPPSEVTGNPSVACASGLHVGSLQYAKRFRGGQEIIMVSVDPRDVVSVPYDENNQKMRVSKYFVISKWEEND